MFPWQRKRPQQPGSAAGPAATTPAGALVDYLVGQLASPARGRGTRPRAALPAARGGGAAAGAARAVSPARAVPRGGRSGAAVHAAGAARARASGLWTPPRRPELSAAVRGAPAAGGAALPLPARSVLPPHLRRARRDG